MSENTLLIFTLVIAGTTIITIIIDGFIYKYR